MLLTLENLLKVRNTQPLNQVKYIWVQVLVLSLLPSVVRHKGVCQQLRMVMRSMGSEEAVSPNAITTIL